MIDLTEGAVCQAALRTVRIQQEALAILNEALQRPPLDQAINDAVTAISQRAVRVIVTGMGKSGLVGRKIAATLRSTGTPAYFLHPAEASHGDLGMITGGDVVLALSRSGETAELVPILDFCRQRGNLLIVMTSEAESRAGRSADICITVPTIREACPHQLAPTSSTTVQAVLGDAIAIALIERREFSSDEFLTLHPGGQLGGRFITVGQLMGHGDAIPRVMAEATLADAVIEMGRTRYGATAVVDGGGGLLGAFTDGDLRRSLVVGTSQDAITGYMSHQPVIARPDTLASDALRLMNDNAITMLFVCEADQLVGAIHLHDLLRLGIL